MQMMVAEGVTLVKPLADGRDYVAGELIDLDPVVAEDYMKRGWVGHTPLVRPIRRTRE